MKVGLVLGAGGTVGMAYHVGVLRALRDEAGLDPARADLIIGTSAGSVIGAYLRSGLALEEMWEQTFGDGDAGRQAGVLAVPVLPGSPLASAENGVSRDKLQIFAPAFHSPLDLIAHLLGSAFVLARSAVRVPLPSMPRFLRHAFPGGMFSLGEGRQRLEHDLPAAWPEQPLWLCAVDIVSGQRLVLGREGSPPATLSRAVMASCAIPGVYPPVSRGKKVLVDGGVHSSTNLDLAVAGGCDLIIGVAPMAFDTEDRNIFSPANLFRRPPAVTLAHEVAMARQNGATVLLLRPNRAEVEKHGFNLMRREGLDGIATRAYEATADKLESHRFREALEAAGTTARSIEPAEREVTPARVVGTATGAVAGVGRAGPPEAEGLPSASRR